jgi:cytochrome c oxidase assembly factor CtaG
MHEIVHIAAMGLITSVLAPAVILLSRGLLRWRVLSWPAAVALPFFLVLHGTVMIWMDVSEPPPLEHTGLDALLFVGAIVFWLPVLGYGRRLDPIGRCVYLYLAAPTLDLAGVVIVARGDSAGGLAMIAGMLPIGLAAVALTWRLLQQDEARARALDLADPVTPPPIAPSTEWVATRCTTNQVGPVESPHAHP